MIKTLIIICDECDREFDGNKEQYFESDYEGTGEYTQYCEQCAKEHGLI